jgi:general stress protein 26
MSNAEPHSTTEVTRLLAATAKTIANVRYCWLLTPTETGAINARPMGHVTRHLDESDWTLRFITDGRSRKASDIRRAGNATVIFQNADDAFVSLVGPTTVCDEASEVSQHWKSAYDSYFSTEHDRANAALIVVRVQRMELWIKGVTPEPFGMVPTRIERDSHGEWRNT